MQNYMFYNTLTINIQELFYKDACNRLTQRLNLSAVILNKD